MVSEAESGHICHTLQKRRINMNEENCWLVVTTRVLGKMGIMLVMCGILALATGQAIAAGDTIKVGLVVHMTGPFADSGRQITNAAKTYMAQHGDTVAGKKIELVVKDVGGPAPEVAKRLCQELVVKDKVDFIGGFSLTPDALACAPVATESKTPLIDMLAATSIITTKSPYIVRTSFTLAQVSE